MISRRGHVDTDARSGVHQVARRYPRRAVVPGGLIRAAADQETGEAASTQITLSSGLDGGEIDRIIEEDRTGRVATAGVSDDLILDSDNLAPESIETSSSDVPILETSDSDELEIIDEEEFIELTEAANAPADDITLAVATPAPTGDTDDEGGFFDPSGLDLSEADDNVELELEAEEI